MPNYQKVLDYQDKIKEIKEEILRGSPEDWLDGGENELAPILLPYDGEAPPVPFNITRKTMLYLKNLGGVFAFFVGIYEISFNLVGSLLA